MKKLLIIAMLFVLVSCTTTRYIEIPVETTRTEYIDRTRIDTLIQKDSTIIKQKGDTVFQDRYKILYRIKEYRDTINRTDTITKVQKVEVTKEINRLKSWQIILMVCGGGLIGLLLYKLIKLIKSWT